ncbi:hypothetical protein TruAng_012052 [Truncatella angustata]|nr:hypothetical protein TruAng_012052 [Truncatella angustata]
MLDGPDSQPRVGKVQDHRVQHPNKSQRSQISWSEDMESRMIERQRSHRHRDRRSVDSWHSLPEDHSSIPTVSLVRSDRISITASRSSSSSQVITGIIAVGSATGSSTSGSFSSQGGSSHGDAETRALVGSSAGSYQFKQDGLIKKTISLSYNTTTHHIVSYYTIEDVKFNILHRPSETFLRDYPPRPELIQSSNFRVPVDDNDIFFMPDNP